MTKNDHDTPLYLKFADLEAPVALHDSQGLLPMLSTVLADWPFIVTQVSTVEPCFSITRHSVDRFYCQTSDQGLDRKSWDAVNAVCDLVAELAWEQIRSNRFALCLHCSAVEFEGRLVLFPNGRRAGKSTLTACLAARGHQVFSDDFLPVEIDEFGVICGLASGILPRVRMPTPDDFSAEFSHWILDNPGPENKQYKYLKIDQLAARGTRMPIGAVVMLDRDADADVQLRDMDPSAALDGMITQNFERNLHSGLILKTAAKITDAAELFQLIYSSAENAADILEAHFSSWNTPPILFGQTDPLGYKAAKLSALEDTTEDVAKDAIYARATGLTEVNIDGASYIADETGLGVHKLNAGSSAIWTLLADPIGLSEIVDVLSAAFPDVAGDQIARDSEAALQGLLENRLIQPVDLKAKQST